MAVLAAAASLDVPLKKRAFRHLKSINLAGNQDLSSPGAECLVGAASVRFEESLLSCRFVFHTFKHSRHNKKCNVVLTACDSIADAHQPVWHRTHAHWRALPQRIAESALAGAVQLRRAPVQGGGVIYAE
jgi:hypothetical protein